MAARFLAQSALALLILASAVAAQEIRTLTTARELRALTAEEAQRPYPVRLTATVTLVEPGRTIFLRDETGATFIRGGGALLRSGQRIEIEGETYAGLYVTGVVAKHVKVLADGEPLKPIPLSFEQLASGQYHYEWVEVRGIIRAASSDSEYPILKLALGDGSLDVFPVAAEAVDPSHLVDATVRVVGLAAGFINDRRQLVAPHLRLRSLSDISVLEPAPAEPFAVATTPAAELLRFSPDGRAGHRVKVRGAVTYHEQGSAVYLRDVDQGVRVRTETAEYFSPGEVVEALGFPVMGRLSAELEDATLQRTGETEPVPPVRSMLKGLLSGKSDADLVQVEGVVRDVVREADAVTLVIEAEGLVLPALARGDPPSFQLPEPGARVRLTGVCRVSQTTQPARSYNTRARRIELLLRSVPGDVTVLQEPPWWNARRLSIAASTLLGVTLLAVIWGLMLRRQVRRQTALIRTQVEDAAVAEERQRIAREFHDTLEQELVGVSLRLDAASTRAADTRLRELLAEIKRLIQQLQAGARAFVWNLRDENHAHQSLGDAIAAAVTNIVVGRKFEIHTIGDALRIPELIAHDLLRIAQEATVNAVKHGNANEIAIEIAFSPTDVRLAVTDDGSGFDPGASVPSGHFGMMGMRERMQKLGGEFHVHSAPGGGTSIQVRVPLQAKPSETRPSPS